MSDYSGRWALITGASSGIGTAYARAYAAHGCKLVLVARREERLHELAEELKKRHGTECLVVPADLSDPASPQNVFAATEERGIAVDILVNNAGHGIPGRYLHHDWERHAAYIELMVKAVCHTTHLYLPGMTKRKFGRIINVASVAALLPAAASQTLYAASKAFMVRFSEAVSAEYSSCGVHVSVVCPGFTLSEFHDVMGNRAKVSKQPKFMWLQADAVVEDSIRRNEANQPMIVSGWVYKVIVFLSKILPYKLFRTWIMRSNRRMREVPIKSND